MDLPPPPASTRSERPLTVSLAVGIPGGPGLDVAYQLTDRVAVSAQAATWLAVTDVGAQVRVFVLAGEQAGLYLGAGLHGLYSPLLFPTVAPALSLELGGEYRAHSGFTLAGGVGAMPLYAPPGSEGGSGFSLAPRAQLRIGYSW